jgi:hypothetical protein
VKLDGTSRSLWKICLGPNIRSGAHYVPVMVADFDGDGLAEVICRTADGTVDGTGRTLSGGVFAKGATFKFSGSFWGATHADPTMRCCAFYESGGRWIGGFWEWGSPDRTYRGYENIADKYKGWDPAAWNAAKRRAFCVCSKDGKKRTNIVEA